MNAPELLAELRHPADGSALQWDADQGALLASSGEVLGRVVDEIPRRSRR